MAVAQQLPQGSCQAGDRHLNFNETRDNLLAFFQGQYSTNTALMGAAAVLVALPVVVVYLFLQRHFIRGMVEGAVKD